MKTSWCHHTVENTHTHTHTFTAQSWTAFQMLPTNPAEPLLLTGRTKAVRYRNLYHKQGEEWLIKSNLGLVLPLSSPVKLIPMSQTFRFKSELHLSKKHNMDVSEQNKIMMIVNNIYYSQRHYFVCFQLLITSESKKKNINLYYLSIQDIASQLYAKQTVNIKWLTPCAK